ncbi:MAG: hypothetical protein V9G19_11110 [Tetrasphaera sp.]
MIEVVLLDRKDIPSVGAGETPIIAVAPAIGNAIFHATGPAAVYDAARAGWSGAWRTIDKFKEKNHDRARCTRRRNTR